MNIKITCEGCNTIHSVDRTSEIPKHIASMGCNWCPKCEDDADDYYDEWYNESDSGDNKKPTPQIVNQLSMFTLYPDETHFEKERKESIELT